MEKGKKENLSVQILQLVDAGLIALSFWLVAFLRNPFRELIGLEALKGRSGLDELTWILLIVVPFLPIILEILGFYSNPLRKKLGRSMIQLLQGIAIVVLVVGVFVVFGQVPVASRWIIGAGILLSGIFLLLREKGTRSVILHSIRAEDAKEAVVISGSKEEVAEFLEQASEDFEASWKIEDRIDLREVSLEIFEEKIKKASVGKVIFLSRGTEFGHLAEAVELCELLGIESWISAGFIRTRIARPDFDLLAGKPMLVLRSAPELSWALLAKSVFDRLIAAVVILLSLPIWLFAAIGVKLKSPSGPVFFKQQRAGLYGRPFTMFKFRTMIPDAEARLEELKERGDNEMTGPVFKLEKDPRVFAFGDWLRRTSIDELPQLLNVLRGDMSLVGPRPLPLYEVEEFEQLEHRRRLSVRPGITCIWQAEGRNQITEFEDWVKMDLDYIDNWSLWLDFKILLKTIPAVLLSRGAK